MEKSTKNKSKSRVIYILSILMGLAAGYAYYYYIGCASGNCSIASSPFTMMLFGGLIGYVVGDSIKDKLMKSSES